MRKRLQFNKFLIVLVILISICVLGVLLSSYTGAEAHETGNSRLAEVVQRSTVDLSDRLLMKVDDTLYLLDLETETPIIITESLHVAGLRVSPDEASFLYSFSENDEQVLAIYDLDANRSFEAYRSTGQAFLFEWSVNGQYVAFTEVIRSEDVMRVGIIDVIGQETLTYDLRHQTKTWLADSTLLVVRLGEELEPDLIRVLPTYDDWDELGPADGAMVNAITQPDQWLSGQDIIKNMGFELAPLLEVNASGGLAVASDSSGLVMLKPVDPTAEQPACGNLRVWKHPLLEVFTPEIVIEAGDEVQNIGALTLTSEGDIFFVTDITEACGASETESLLMYRPSGESVAVIDNVPIVDGYRSGRPYTLSPDERYLIWLPAGSEGEALMLRVWDREENTTFDMTVDGLAMPDEAAQVSLVDWIE